MFVILQIDGYHPDHLTEKISFEDKEAAIRWFKTNINWKINTLIDEADQYVAGENRKKYEYEYRLVEIHTHEE